MINTMYTVDSFKIGHLYGIDDRASNDSSSPRFKGKWWSLMLGKGFDIISVTKS